MRFVFLVFLFSFVQVQAAGVYIDRNCLKKTSIADGTLDQLRISCIAVRDSKECKKFSSTLAADNQNKLRSCSDKELYRRINGSFIADEAMACAGGAIIEPVADLYKLAAGSVQAVADWIYYLPDAWKKADACDVSTSQKLALVNANNMGLPIQLRYLVFSEDKLKNISCSDLNKTMSSQKEAQISKLHDQLLDKKKSGQKLTPADLEFESFENKTLKSSKSLSQMVDQMAQDFNLSLQCYKPEEVWAIRCEMAATIAAFAIPGLGEIRAANLAAKLGVQTEKVQQSLAALQALTREERIEKATREIATLSETEKLALAQQELHRSKDFTDVETKAIKKSHDYADKGYGNYTGDDLREKKRILMSEGKFTETEADYFINRGLVGNPPRVINEDVAQILNNPDARRGVEHARKVAQEAFGRKDVTDEQAAAYGNYWTKGNDSAVQALRDSGLSEAEVAKITSNKMAPAVSAEARNSTKDVQQFFADFKPKADPTKAEKAEVDKLITAQAKAQGYKYGDEGEFLVDRFNNQIQKLGKLETEYADASTLQKVELDKKLKEGRKMCAQIVRVYESAGYDHGHTLYHFKNNLKNYKCE